MVVRSFQREIGLDTVSSEEIVQQKVAPAAVLAVVHRRRDGPWEGRIGAAGIRSALRPTPAEPETVFDIASVTKPVVAAAAARLASRKEIDFAAPMGSLIELARGTPTSDLPLELLLAHRAGLEAHLPLYAPAVDGPAPSKSEMLRAAAMARRRDCAGAAPKEGFAPVYSDMGYALVGEALSVAAGLPLEDVVAREVARPLDLALGSARQWTREDATFGERVAPTETVDWRGGEIVGVVHDENAWILEGTGLAGHAGGFATAAAVAAFGAALLDAAAGRSDWLAAEALEPLIRRRPGGTLRAGFDGKSAGVSSSGSQFGEATFGHLGFTGTSLWCDPESERAVALLTNRVCPTREHIAIRKARPRVHDRAWELADGWA